VVPEGGAICSKLGPEDAYVPDFDVIHRLVGRLPMQLHRLFRSMSFEAQRPLILSEEVDMQRMQEFGQHLQRAVASTHDRIIALVGSHKAPRYAAAASLALTQQDLGGLAEEDNSARGRSLILACSRFTVDHHPSDAVETFTDAFELSADPRMVGRAGVLFRKKLYALYGLQRPQDPIDFSSRFPPIATKGERGNWYFTDVQPYHMPCGEHARPFRLDTHVQTFVLEGAEDKVGNVIDMMHTRKMSGELHGIVLKTDGGRHPYAYHDQQRLEEINDVQLPCIAVGRRNGNGEERHVVCDEAEQRYPFIMNGGALQSGEAKLFLAKVLAEADASGASQQLTDCMAFIRHRLDRHPFLN